MGFFDKLFNYNREEVEVRTALEDYKSKHDKLASVVETLDDCMEYLFTLKNRHGLYEINDDVFISFFNNPKKYNRYVIYYMEKVYYHGDYSINHVELIRRDEKGYNFDHAHYATLLKYAKTIENHTTKLVNTLIAQVKMRDQFVDWLDKVETTAYVNAVINDINDNLDKPLKIVHECLNRLIRDFNVIAQYEPDDKALLKESGLEFILHESQNYGEDGYPNNTFSYTSTVRYNGEVLYNPGMSYDELLNNLINTDTDWYDYFKKIRLDSFKIATQEGAFERFKRIHKYFPNNYADENYHIEYKLYYKYSDDYYPSIEYITIHDMTNGGKCVYYYDGVKDKIEIKKRGKWVFKLDSKMKLIDYNKKENERKAKEREYKRRTGDYRP